MRDSGRIDDVSSILLWLWTAVKSCGASAMRNGASRKTCATRSRHVVDRPHQLGHEAQFTKFHLFFVLFVHRPAPRPAKLWGRLATIGHRWSSGLDGGKGPQADGPLTGMGNGTLGYGMLDVAPLTGARYEPLCHRERRYHRI